MEFHQANGAKFHVGDDMIVAWERKTHNVFEPQTTEWIFDRLDERPDGAFLDVGAATGWFSIPVAMRGRDVIAVEANKRVFGRLVSNIAVNRVCLATHNVAASDQRGTATFMFNHRLPLTSGGSLEAPSSTDYRTETVSTERLDDLIDAPMAVMKVDVEGHELPVLRGAARIIAESRPHIVLEANTPDHVKALDAWCRDNGYDWVEADERNMLCSPAS